MTFGPSHQLTSNACTDCEVANVLTGGNESFGLAMCPSGCCCERNHADGLVYVVPVATRRSASISGKSASLTGTLPASQIGRSQNGNCLSAFMIRDEPPGENDLPSHSAAGISLAESAISPRWHQSVRPLVANVLKTNPMAASMGHEPFLTSSRTTAMILVWRQFPRIARA